MKTAIVTGASGGIGEQTARLLSASGYRVLAFYNSNKQAAECIQAELNAAGGDVHLFKADFSDQKQVEQAFKQIALYYKKIDLLVNVAGISVVGTVEDVDACQVEKMWQINALSAYNCCRLCLPLLKSAQSPSVVNVSSIWGLHGASCEVGYAMTKHAVIGLTKSLAEEWAYYGISVTCVCPPVVQTKMCAHLSEKDLDEFCKQTHTTVYTPAAVAKDILFLATQAKSGTILEEK